MNPELHCTVRVLYIFFDEAVATHSNFAGNTSNLFS